MTFAHVLGFPVEESALALAPAGAAIVTGAMVIARAKLAEVVRRLRRHSGSGPAGRLPRESAGAWPSAGVASGLPKGRRGQSG
jgi:hypothetical protein